jgi:hypothetical protein
LTAIAERTDLWHAKCPPCISGECMQKVDDEHERRDEEL